jgi:arylsulfatase A-like enzyme
VDGGGFPRSARLVDLAPTILAAAGAPASVRHSGAALPAVAAGELAMDVTDAVGASLEGRQGLDDMEAEEVEEHLRGLGYLE